MRRFVLSALAIALLCACAGGPTASAGSGPSTDAPLRSDALFNDRRGAGSRDPALIAPF